MNLSLFKHLASFVGRAALVLATFAQVPLISTESQVECESIAILARDSVNVETRGACARATRVGIQARSQGRCTLAKLMLGHDGRRLSATLLAPLRC